MVSNFNWPSLIRPYTIEASCLIFAISKAPADTDIAFYIMFTYSTLLSVQEGERHGP